MIDQSRSPTLVSSAPLSTQDLERIDAYWRAANYLSVGQIYLLAAPPHGLSDPRSPQHVLIQAVTSA